jgi:hypothetical protein
MKAMPKKPKIIIAHVEGSGTAPATLSVVTQFPKSSEPPAGVWYTIKPVLPGPSLYPPELTRK